MRILWYGEDGTTKKRQAVVPCIVRGASCPLIPRKGGLPMVTYSDLIQTGILVVAIIALFLQANNKK